METDSKLPLTQSFCKHVKNLLPYSFVNTLILLMVAFTAVFSIAEIAARESVLSIISGQISTRKSEFVEQSRESSITQLVGTATVNVDRADAMRYMLNEIQWLEGTKQEVQTLIALGSDEESHILRNVRRSYIDKGGTGGTGGTEGLSLLTSFIRKSTASLLMLSSDQLLAIAIMACGSIGAMITALRGDSAMTLRSLSLGLASGFVVYLAIKGGKHVFLLQTQGELVTFNPYGSGFAGLLSGLFTEKAHQLLTTIIDDFAARLRAASGGKQ
ncbi:MAG: hypothetical protein HW390_1097 [Candidatus Brocadiaceae bacterium]|nr:hypothetical protein [Candidatus Brocadiaceae bacterium]